MPARHALPLFETSPSVAIPPRPTTLAPDDQLSLSLAPFGVPIKHCAGDGEVLLREQLRCHDPALLIANLRLVDDRFLTKPGTIVSPRHVLLAVNPNDDHPIQLSNILHHLEHHTAFPSRPRTPPSSWNLGFFTSTTSVNKGLIKHGSHAQVLLDTSTVHSFKVSITLPTPYSAMSALIADTAPGTPPELSGSQSSKASSYASQISSPEEYSGGSMNFEEINLDDDQKSDNFHYGGRSGPDNKENVQIFTTSPKRPALSTIQTKQAGHLRLVENGTKSAATPSTKRNFSSPVMSHGSPRLTQRTRSESPALHKTLSASRLGQYAQSPATSLTVPGRRGSWQPSRKTIYELEAEYHDSDDELPDDASLFNVPLSPFAQRQSSRPPSARSSARGSPERESPATSPGPVPLSHARSAPDAPKRNSSSRKLPRQRLTPRSSSATLKQSKSASTSPRAEMRYGRTKSWNLVMADLDYEARIIAEKLDFHLEASAKSQSASTNSHRTSAPGAIPLPPVQRGTLDFMPISKEKEAVLSRTRPSWLPPKDPKEEKRHLEQYKQMMKASIEAERKREESLKAQPNAVETTRDSLHRIWAFYVDPNTDLAVIDKRVYDLCWRGIPPSLRGRVWQRTVGNSLNLTREGFQATARRVTEIKGKPLEKLTEQEKIMQEWFADIERDAETAFPDLSFFKRNGPQWQDLIDLCEVFALYRGDIGYNYGMQLVAALILIQVPDPAEAFILMANCLNKAMPLAFQTGDVAATSRAHGKVKSTLEIKFPRLYNYLFNDREDGGLGFSGEELFDPMFKTLFANGLDMDRLCRVWDIWLFESDRYLIRTAVALLGALEEQIFDMKGDVDLRRRNIQEMLGWGPCNRSESGYWKLETSCSGGDSFVELLRAAGKLDCAGN